MGGFAVRPGRVEQRESFNVSIQKFLHSSETKTKRQCLLISFFIIQGGFFALTLSQTLGPSRVAFCVPTCPVADTYKRASYLRSSVAGRALSDGYVAFHDPEKSARILEKQLGFWVDDGSMREARGALKENRKGVPTLLIVSCDKNAPLDVTADVQSWATRTIVIGGRGHELCDGVVEGGGYHCYLPDIDRFVDHCLSRRDVESAK